MPQSALPVNVRQLLKEHIRSIEQLEILLLLQGGADRLWTPPEIYQVVQSNERSVSATLETLCRQGLLRKTEPPQTAYQFSPQTPEVKEAVRELAKLYAEKRVRIVQAIYSEGVSAADEFAKAFRLRKDDNG
jgi:hypothetical protein